MSHTFITHRTELANWHDLILRGQRDSRIVLEHDVEAYVVLMLMRYMKDPNFANIVLGLEYLRTFKFSGQKHTNNMQRVADQCLLYAGFFPERAIRKRVSKEYFSDLGQSAYALLMDRLVHAMPSLSSLYRKLCSEFVSISQVLFYMRKQEDYYSFT